MKHNCDNLTTTKIAFENYIIFDIKDNIFIISYNIRHMSEKVKYTSHILKERSTRKIILENVVPPIEVPDMLWPEVASLFLSALK